MDGGPLLCRLRKRPRPMSPMAAAGGADRDSASIPTAGPVHGSRLAVARPVPAPLSPLGARSALSQRLGAVPLGPAAFGSSGNETAVRHLFPDLPPPLAPLEESLSRRLCWPECPTDVAELDSPVSAPGGAPLSDPPPPAAPAPPPQPPARGPAQGEAVTSAGDDREAGVEGPPRVSIAVGGPTALVPADRPAPATSSWGAMSSREAETVAFRSALSRLREPAPYPRWSSLSVLEQLLLSRLESRVRGAEGPALESDRCGVLTVPPLARSWRSPLPALVASRGSAPCRQWPRPPPPPTAHG